jgi:tRNA U34 2-thiouridine synthase MnmA/TrmU
LVLPLDRNAIRPPCDRRELAHLSHLGDTQVRKLAAAADLANKNRKDSQGICFLGKVRREWMPYTGAK